MLVSAPEPVHAEILDPNAELTDEPIHVVVTKAGA